MNPELKLGYNSISKDYNNRYKFNELPGIYNSLKKIIALNNYNSILEVGCGTGHWLNKIQDKNRKIFACDISTGMLKEALKTTADNHLFCADANRLPLFKSKFDLIFCVNALHLFDDKRAFISDVKKLLSPNGSLCIYGIDPRFRDDQWYLYDFFEGCYKNDLLRFPSFENIREYFNQAGFDNTQFETVEKIHTVRTAENVLDDPFLQKGGSSQLLILSENNYKKGIEKIHSAIKNKSVKTFVSKFTFSLISGKNI